MQRKISVSLYVLALVISLFLFGLGIYVGGIINRSNLEGISGDIDTISQQISGAQLMFLLEDSSAFCPVYQSELERLDQQTLRLGDALTFLEERKGVRDDSLKDRYFVLEAQTYLLSRKVREKCEQSYPLILYFYSNAQCDRCRDQGAALLEIKQRMPEARIYSFDGTLGSPVARALQAQFNVSTYPSLVINGETYRDFQSGNRIIEIVNR